MLKKVFFYIHKQALVDFNANVNRFSSNRQTESLFTKDSGEVISFGWKYI